MGKGVSTIIAAIFIIMIFMLIFVYLAYTMRNFGDIATRFVEIVNEAATRERESLRVTYVIANNTGIYLGLRNEGIVTSIIRGYSVRDLSNNSVQYGTFTNPYAIPPGGNADIHILGNYSQDATYLITLVTEVGSVVRTKYPQPVTNITRAYLLKQQLQTIAGEGTATWAGQAVMPISHNTTFNITYAEISGEPLSNPVILERSEGIGINISTVNATVVLLKNNSVIYDDFEEGNPFNAGKMRKLSGRWKWKRGYGYNGGGGLYQSKEEKDKDTRKYGGEAIAIFNRDISNYNSFYALAYIYHNDFGKGRRRLEIIPPRGIDLNEYGEVNLVLFENSTSFYTLGSFVGKGRIEIQPPQLPLPLPRLPPEFPLYGAIICRYSGDNNWYCPSFSPLLEPDLRNRWLIYLSKYDKSRGLLAISIYDTMGEFISGTSFTFNSLSNPRHFGLGTWYQDAYFDNVVVSRGNPRYLNVTGVPEGWTASITSALSNLSDTSVNGTVVFDVLRYPIMRNAIISVYNDGINVSKAFRVIVGGDVYAFGVSINVTTTYEGNSLISKLYVCTSFSTNTSVNAVLRIFNFNTKRYDIINESQGITFINACFPISNINAYMDSNNRSIVNLIIYSNKPFEGRVDMLNINATTYIPVTKDVLVVGVGDTSRVDVYELGFSGANLTLSYVKSIDVHSMFNGSTDITYDSDVTMSLIVVNGSGVYSVSLYSGKFNVINDSPPYFPSPGLVSVRAEVLDGKLLVVRGFTNGNDYLLIDLSNGNIVENGSLGVNISCTKYCVSASDGSNAYILVLNTSMGRPVIMRYSLGSGWEVLTNFTGYKSTGMCFGNGYLYVMLEMGGLYRVSVNDGSYELLNVNLPFYPRGFGDRLEYYAGNLIFVRDDDTTEVWVISPIG